MILSSKEVAELLGWKVRTVQAAAKRNGIGSRKGTMLLFTPEDVERFKGLRRPGRPRIVKVQDADKAETQ